MQPAAETAGFAARIAIWLGLDPKWAVFIGLSVICLVGFCLLIDEKIADEVKEWPKTKKCWLQIAALVLFVYVLALVFSNYRPRRAKRFNQTLEHLRENALKNVEKRYKKNTTREDRDTDSQ